MRTTWLSLLLIGALACQQQPDSDPAAEATPGPTSARAVEHIESSSFSLLDVNGRPNEETTVRQLEQTLGRPDSIARGVVECVGELGDLDGSTGPGDLWFYGPDHYEVNGTRAILAGHGAASKHWRARLDNVPLTAETTLESLRATYPKAVEEASQGPEARQEMLLPFQHQGTITDASLHLIFEQGKLVFIDIYMPC